MMRTIVKKEKIEGSYVYALLDPSTEQFIVDGFILPHRPFYIGKGKGYRAWDHEKEKLSESCNKHKVHKIMKIKNNFNYIPIFIFKDGLTEGDALSLEEYYAKIVGYENLVNINPCGARNPILFAELNGFYGKRHPDDVINNITTKWKSWFQSLSVEERDQYRKNRKEGFEKIIKQGYEYLPEWIEKRLKSRFGENYRDIISLRESEKEKNRIEKKRRSEEKNKEKMSRGWSHLKGEDIIEYWKRTRSGENNGMFGKGHLLSNENNGRAKKYIVTIGKDKFLIHGRLKQFQKAFKNFYKCSDPLRSEGFIQKYNVTVLEVEEFNTDGIMFIDESSFFELKRYYTKCKKPNTKSK